MSTVRIRSQRSKFSIGAAQPLGWLAGSKLRQSHAGLRAGFEHREQVREAEKIPDRFVVVDQDQLAAALFRGDVEADDGAQAGTIHAGDFPEVDDDSATGGEQITDMVLQGRGVFHGQATLALNNHGVVPRPCFQSQVGRRNRCRIQWHVRTPLVGELYIETWGLGEWKSITRCKLCKKDAIPAVLSNALLCCDLPSSPYVHETGATLPLDQQEGANGKHA